MKVHVQLYNVHVYNIERPYMIIASIHVNTLGRTNLYGSYASIGWEISPMDCFNSQWKRLGKIGNSVFLSRNVSNWSLHFCVESPPVTFSASPDSRLRPSTSAQRAQCAWCALHSVHSASLLCLHGLVGVELWVLHRRHLAKMQWPVRSKITLTEE